MRIAVVDDDYRIIAQITEYLSIFFCDIAYQQDDYTNGYEFVHALTENKYNIVFMDLEMGCTNGGDAIKHMREIDKNENTFVLFVSSHEDNLIPLFALHPFGFIQKPISYEKVARYLAEINLHIKEDKHLLPLTIERKNVLLPVSDILYVHSERHKLIIHLHDQTTCETYEKLDLLEKKISDMSTDFLRIHTSFLVNKKYVTLYKRDCLYIGQIKLQISRKYTGSVINNLHRNS